MTNSLLYILEKTQEKNAVLIAASKTHGIQQIHNAKRQGVTNFGENYMQEALTKLEAFEGCTLHFIGHLQTKKAGDAIRHFDCIHSVDRTKLAKELEKECIKQERASVDIFIQVNQGGETSKGGISEEEVGDLITYVRESCPHLNLLGLMSLPPQGQGVEKQFKALREIANQYQLKHLSMGMSSDWELALKNGATHIRVGSAIFGPR